ncbi:hypothetical protein B0T26DRAFT_171288 [Lasiosphaeria miniovina]|uniref:Uncharacterized protein n=1 Tax=Lasiosphaeria miniovina TaxID=1954250 RepID=A0AA40B653_9PEZI|nr:uncharacterized protein B0T26DRAFT_171288 [Lasiosphaeria miniovina]KAK0728426.1 hypothetical protein B0T26DRAFT_171288 [Lasiosphaeria miniovina]
MQFYSSFACTYLWSTAWGLQSILATEHNASPLKAFLPFAVRTLPVGFRRFVSPKPESRSPGFSDIAHPPDLRPSGFEQGSPCSIRRLTGPATAREHVQVAKRHWAAPRFASPAVIDSSCMITRKGCCLQVTFRAPLPGGCNHMHTLTACKWDSRQARTLSLNSRSAGSIFSPPDR